MVCILRFIFGVSAMSDEQAIRELFSDWIKSTVDGNLELARQCIADDAAFFVPGAGVMDKETFAQGVAGGSPEESLIEYDLDSKIHELQVFGDKACLCIESTLVCTPKNGDPATRMAGYSLSLLEKRAGRWQILRDANTMTVVAE